MVDTNVGKLVELCKNIEATYFDIMDLNGIEQKEVEEYVPNDAAM